MDKADLPTSLPYAAVSWVELMNKLPSCFLFKNDLISLVTELVKCYYQIRD